MKKIKYALLAMSLMVVLTGCSTKSNTNNTEAPAVSENTTSETEVPATAVSEEITITHELGETKVKTNPQKVVVFDLGILDALDYAGVETVVGVPQSTTMPEHLAKYAENTYANVGSLSEADFEKINELKPDVIIISARMSSAYEQLSEIAPTVFAPMPGDTYLATFEQNMNMLATIFTNQADTLLAEVNNIKTTVAEINQKTTSEGLTALITLANDGEISVFGYGSRYGMLYNDFGFTVTDTTIEKSTHGQAATFEYLAEQNPAYLFVVDRSAAIGTGEEESGAKKLLDNDLINGMDAAKNGHITYLNSTNWYMVAGGISSTKAMLEEVKTALE